MGCCETIDRPESVPAPAEVMEGLVLVTGAGGFLGGNIVRALREYGVRVRGLVRRQPRQERSRADDGVEFVVGDVRRPDEVAAAMVGVRYVIHAAGLTHMVPLPRGAAFQVNVQGTRNVCEAARRAGVRRLVFTSSLGTVATLATAGPVSEDDHAPRWAVRTPYHRSKWLAERVVRSFAAQGLETVILNPAFMIGPRDPRPTTNELLLFAARNRPAALPPGGINVIDVREAACAHVRALWMGQSGERYFLAGPYRSYTELGRLVRRIAGVRWPLYTLPRWTYAPGSLLLALLPALWPEAPASLACPNFQAGFRDFRASGERADRTFHLSHRPLEESVWDTLHWFQASGLAPWLPRHLRRPDD
ncbi:MAG: NAD-dependent epimerase/dehydratase family protein [Gemmataceae bacterium]|nr:NAD-dependent epimerase/dehydratase family protein [Gemmataceae bacterium]MDW8266244.1 NAD-dependent epimerase/dehydratase family protein [Gemmataceae bacterium]